MKSLDTDPWTNPDEKGIVNADAKVHGVLEKLRTAGDEIETREAWMEKLITLVNCPDCNCNLEIVTLFDGPNIKCVQKGCNFNWP